MQSNTVVFESQLANFPNYAVEKRTYKPDPFTIKDGRYVGSDGFVVPKDFEEFYQRYPDYVCKWVNKHADRSAPQENLEDWTQDLLIHLCRLSQMSKHRQAGKNDIVQTFDPMKHYGANEARFRNYINLCLTNKFRTMYSKRIKDALCHPGNTSLDGQTEGERFRSVDEFCYAHSAQLRAAAKASEKRSADRAFLEEFLTFVRREDSKVLPTIEAILATGTHSEAAEWLGLTDSEFCRMRNRLKQLSRCFLLARPVPRERKPYKERAAKTNQLSGSQPNGLNRITVKARTSSATNRTV